MGSFSSFFFFFHLYYAWCAGEKTCPEPVKAHLTRCDMYYKCQILPSETLVWTPITCPRGLIYDQNWKMCVLPGKDNMNNTF